ncbi:fibronectin type III domain protein [Ostertagia ostertagi]
MFRPLTQLITWREYEIQVAAYNHRGLGVFSKSIDVTTAEGVPTQAPKNVIANVLNSTAVEITFTAPDQQRIPGVNLGYKVALRFSRDGCSSRAMGFLEITFQVEFWKGHYNVTVLCYTSPGDGPRNHPVLVVTDEDTPGPVNGLSIAEVMFNGAVVMWDLPEHPNGIITRFVLRYWNDASPDDKSVMEFESAHKETLPLRGDGPREETKFESGVPPELPGRPSSLTLSDIRARSVLLSFVPGFDGHTAIRQWIVEAKVADSSVFRLAPKARSITVTGLRPFTRYQMRLIAENVRGRGAPSEPSIAFETKQTNPETPASRLFAEPLSSTSLSLSWTPLLANQWNGQPKGYLDSRTKAVRAWQKKKYKAMRACVQSMSVSTEMPSIPSLRASDFILRDLQPYTSYEVQLFAENMFGRSSSSGASEAKIRLEPEQEWLRADGTRTFSVSGATVLAQTVTGLRAFTSYFVFVSACTIVGCGPENRVPTVVLTPEDVPEVPTGVSFSLISENEAYFVSYWKSDEDRTTAIRAPLSSTLLFFTANGLEPNKQYTFAVQAENSVAVGPEAVVQVVTTSVRVPVRAPPVPTRNDTKYGSDSIAIRWDDNGIDEDEAPVRFVQVEYQKSNSDEWNALEKVISGQEKGVVVPR